MWIVELALNRPYTFIVLALPILILSPVAIMRTPTDIFPNIDIPVIAVAWQYAGLSPEEMEGRITTVYERVLTTTVDNIEHIESTTVNGTAIVKIYLQPTASIDRANAQVTAVSQTILRQLPPGSLPSLIIDYNASTVPILQLGLSGKNLSESQLNDIALNFLRTQLVTVPGASVPYPFGGKLRQVMVNLNQGLLQAKGLSLNDVLTAFGNQNLILPGGTAKVGQFEYDVDLNGDVKTVQELNDLPVKTIGDTVIYLRDVATVSDGFAPQTNIVRQDSNRGVLVTVLKAGDASTIDVVKGVRQLLPHVAQTLPPDLKIQPLSDQSIFVRGAINGVILEAIIAAALTGLMILLFLGSWRSTLIIAISIPLSILTYVMVLSLLHQTINIMTLGGRLRIYVAVPEVDSQAGAKATLTLDEFPGETFQGTIVRNSDSIDYASRTLNVEVDVDNAQDRIKTGAYVFVHLKLPQSAKGSTDSLIIPANTLLFRSEGLRVGVVRNGHAQLVPITIGRDFGAMVEVVAGLQPADQVIVNPSDSLTSGSPVQISGAQAGGIQ